MLRSEAERRGTLLTLAIHAYHQKHDKWPDKLAKLELEGKSEIKKDPYSEKPFVYKLEDGKPILYSVGDDGDDDGGRHDPKWGEGEKGGDYVFLPFQRSE